METWSDEPISEFTIKVYLDTNILSYLIDDTYSGLTSSIRFLQDSIFAVLVSSNFGIYELAGIRKREHYLRKVIESEKKTNISSLLKYKDDFGAPEVKFQDVKDDIRAMVYTDIDKLEHEWDIDYTSNILHEKLFNPTVELCLSTKISKEDSLMLIFAVLPEPDKPENQIMVLTKDQQFTAAFLESPLDSFFERNSLNSPSLFNINNIKKSDNSRVDLTKTEDDHKLPVFWLNKIVETIVEKNRHLLLGKTFIPEAANFPVSVIPFKLKKNTPLPNNIYVLILNKNLQFIYGSKHLISEFFKGNEIVENNFTSESKPNIAFKLNTEEGDPLDHEIVSKLRDDCFLFIHPHNQSPN